MTTVIHAEISDQLAQQAQRMVERSWATSVESIVAESLRRYLGTVQIRVPLSCRHSPLTITQRLQLIAVFRLA